SSRRRARSPLTSLRDRAKASLPRNLAVRLVLIGAPSDRSFLFSAVRALGMSGLGPAPTCEDVPMVFRLLTRRVGPVGLAMTSYDVWRRIPHSQRKQIVKAVRTHGPRVAAAAAAAAAKRRRR